MKEELAETIEQLGNLVNALSGDASEYLPDESDAESGTTNWLAMVPDCFYDIGRKEYIYLNRRRKWLNLTEGQFKRILRNQGISTKPKDGALMSDADNVILELQHERDVDYAGALAGYNQGFYDMGDKRIIVTSSPTLIKPADVPWNTIDQFLEGLFKLDDIDQRPYVFGWLKLAIESLTQGDNRSAQALAIAGEHDCGKSLFQSMVTLILGGRAAKPYQFMTGSTTFNSDLFGAEHLMLEDEQASTDLRMRRNLGAQIKNITVNELQSCHGKNRDAVMLKPFWRLTITLNDEPENLMVLPPIDDSLRDKIMLLKARKTDMPMPTKTLEQRKRFWNQMVSELPGYIQYLVNEFTIPAELESERFGITHYHHPEVLDAIDTLTPEYKLLSLIDGELFNTPAPSSWSGSSSELERGLCHQDSGVRNEAQRLFSFNTAAGVYLGRLVKKVPDRVEFHRDGRKRTYTIHPPQD